MKPNPNLKKQHLSKIELLVNPHKNASLLIQSHAAACKMNPDKLKKRDSLEFAKMPNHAIILVTMHGVKKPIFAGMVVLFDVDHTTVELGSLFVSPIFRGFGLARLLVNAVLVTFNFDNNMMENETLKIIARVKYGNYPPIPLLKKAGFTIVDISAEEKVCFEYDAETAHKNAIQLYDQVTKQNVLIDEALFNCLCAVHGKVKGGGA